MSSTTQRNVAPGVLTALGIATETKYGQPVSPTSYIPYLDHNLAASNKIIQNQAVRKSIGSPAPGIGSVDVKGTVNLLADVDSVGPILVAYMGSDSVSAVGGAYKHTFKLSNPQNSYTLTADDGNGTLQAFSGCKAESLDLSVKAGDFLNVSTIWVGQTVAVSSGTLTPFYSANPAFEFAHLGTYAGGTSTVGVSGGVPYAVDITDFKVTSKSNNKVYFGSTGGRYAIGIDALNRVTSGSFTAELDNTTGSYFNELMWGSPTGPVPGTLSRQAVNFTFTQSASAALSVTLGQITVEGVDYSRKRNDLLTATIKWSASESQTVVGGEATGNADDLVITLTNTNPTFYS